MEWHTTDETNVLKNIHPDLKIILIITFSSAFDEHSRVVSVIVGELRHSGPRHSNFNAFAFAAAYLN